MNNLNKAYSGVRLGSPYQRYAENIPTKSGSDLITSNAVANYSTPDPALSVQAEPDIVYDKKVKYLVVTSRSRDINNYPQESLYNLTLSQEYKNIHSIELVQAIIPDQNNVTAEPYLLLNIKELDQVMDSVDSQIGEAFAILQMTAPVTAGGFIQMDKRVHENVVMYFETPKSSLSRMTISITNIDGVPFNFGGNGSLLKQYQHTLIFRIVTLEKSRKDLQVRNVY
jgi:hypothetical protein